jgi:hypothetical protein
MSFRSYCVWHVVLLALALFCSKARADEHGHTVQKNIDDLILTNSCVGCDLRGADLNRMILIDADLSMADLSGATFFLADLSGANLSGANLRDAKFGGADLANADLRGADLRGALLDGAFMKGSLMDGKVVEAAAEDSDMEVEATEKVYVPDQSKPKEITDQNQAALTEPSEAIKDVVPAKADMEQGTKMKVTAEVIEQKEDVDTVEAASTATAAATSSRAAQEKSKELMDQNKSQSIDQEVSPETPVTIAPPGQAPPVKTTAPVKAAQVETTQQNSSPQSDAAQPNAEATQAVPEADMLKKKVQETDLVDKVAAAPQEEKEMDAEALAGLRGAVRRLPS